MYDFIIFEHSGLKNHFIDLQTIGLMLRDAGYSVAIANVTQEKGLCNKSNIPKIELSINRSSYQKKDDYLKAVFNELSQMTENFYAGSILSDTNLSWIKYVPKDKKVFLWALRSFFFTEYQRPRISRSYHLSFFNSLYNSWVTKRYKNIRFFVSDTTIRDEFVRLGYEPWRFVIRPERMCTQLTLSTKERKRRLQLLSIGALRPEKRIDLCMKALDKLSPNDIHLTIAGKAYTLHGYEKMLDSMSEGRQYVTRISHRLSNEEYNELINNCDYLILCDEKQPSCVTNGTMAEALLAGKPIIAPNYNPYKYIVEKYGVGLLYEMHNQQSLIDTLKRACTIDLKEYSQGIEQYQRDFLYEKVVKDFSKELKESLQR